MNMPAENALDIPVLPQQLGKSLAPQAFVCVDIGNPTVDRGLMHQQDSRPVRVFDQSVSKPVERFVPDIPVMPTGHRHIETDYPNGPPIPGVEVQWAGSGDVICASKAPPEAFSLIMISGDRIDRLA